MFVSYFIVLLLQLNFIENVFIYIMQVVFAFSSVYINTFNLSVQCISSDVLAVTDQCYFLMAHQFTCVSSV